MPLLFSSLRFLNSAAFSNALNNSRSSHLLDIPSVFNKIDSQVSPTEKSFACTNIGKCVLCCSITLVSARIPAVFPVP